MFFSEFLKFLRAFFDRTPSDDCFLTSIFLSFSEHLFYRAPLGNCLFHVQVVAFQRAKQWKTISQVLLKHVIQEREVAIRRRLFT